MRRLTSRPLLLGLAALIAALLTLSGLTAGAAHADGDDDILSSDGVTWHDSLSRPLFDPDFRWVPGDVQTARFYVRNTHPEDGDLDVVLDRTERTALLDTGHLTISARAGDGAWVDVASGARQVLVDSRDLAGGRQVPVEVRASFPYGSSPNDTMLLSTAIDLTVRISQADAVLDANGSAHDPSNSGGPGGSDGHGGLNGLGGLGGLGGLLPNTGSDLRSWELPLALLLLATGAVLLARRRGKPAPPHPVLLARTDDRTSPHD